jgi:anti-sigma-K factor RskA
LIFANVSVWHDFDRYEMNYSEDHIALAAEYALGTLDADERALVETMMIVDHGFMEVVDAWDRKLSPLHQMVAPIEPPQHLWDNISAALGLGKKIEPVAEPEPEPVVQPQDTPVAPIAVTSTPAAPTATAPPVPDQLDDTRVTPQPPDDSTAVTAALEQVISDQAALDHQVAEPVATVAPDIVVEPVAAQPSQPSNVVPLSSAKRGGLAFGWIMTAVAASLAGVVWLQAYRPDLLPENLRVKPKIQVVEVAAPPAPLPAQFVAVLQQGAAAPAFILTVDTATKNFTVRKVGAAAEPGKSYELWLVSNKLQRPRSLGVIGGSDFTIRPSLAAYDSDTINTATYAVTLEPEGGSPTGIATGPIVYAGTLVESVPALPAQPR